MINPPRVASSRLSSILAWSLALGTLACSEAPGGVDQLSESLAPAKDIEISLLGTYVSGVFAAGAAEIVAHDPVHQRLFVVNAADTSVDVLDISDPSSPTLVTNLDASLYGNSANSVAISGGLVAIAVEAVVRTDPGSVVLLSTDTLAVLSVVEVGALPDMLTFSPDGQYLLVANEGEPAPDYSVDPEGSVSVIDLSGGAAALTQTDVSAADFSAFTPGMLDASTRVFGPSAANPAQDLEPEYIAVSHDSKTAWVTVQEGNALAIVDIATATVTDLVGLGFKDHSLPANALDASDRDSKINIASWPVKGMYQPDAVAAFRHQGQTYLALANEGDVRDWPAFSEETRIGSVTLDPTVFPNAVTLKNNANLGRLKVTKSFGDSDHDGDFDELYSFGARSFSIRGTDGSLIYDSGSELENVTATALPAKFNASHDDNNFDSRSDDKGPEPEGVVVGRAYGVQYAFVGLERVGGVMAFDLSDPAAPRFVTYANNRDFSQPVNTAGAKDLGPEGVLFVPAEESPTAKPLLVIGNEISGTTSIFQIDRAK